MLCAFAGNDDDNNNDDNYSDRPSYLSVFDCICMEIFWLHRCTCVFLKIRSLMTLEDVNKINRTSVIVR